MENSTSLKLLAIGYDPAIMQVVERLLNSHTGWSGVTALTKEDGLEKVNKGDYDAVLLCVGVTATDEAELRSIVALHHLPTTIIRHYGGGSGLLENELRAVLETHNK